MLDEQIEAVFENGVFRPLGPVDLPEHQRVTLVLPTEVDSVSMKKPAMSRCRLSNARPFACASSASAILARFLTRSSRRSWSKNDLVLDFLSGPAT